MDGDGRDSREAGVGAVGGQCSEFDQVLSKPSLSHLTESGSDLLSLHYYSC